LEKKRFVVTSEVQVPLGDDEPEVIIESLGRVKGRVDGVSVSEIELEGVVSDTIKTCGLLKKNNLNAIYQTTTRDKNRFQLQKDLTLAHDTGVENLLVFTEDYGIRCRNQCSSMLIRENWHL
jgi:methylenetetrahydrofolate reductase (NADPH)